jgi:hypothetical protein
MSDKTKLKSVRKNQRSYLNRDFDSFRSELSQYGQTYFSDKITDFSPTGLAGMFIEMAAYIGDNMSFYLDHQFNELDIVTATENKNVERLIRSAGVKIKGASPAIAMVDFYLEVDSVSTDGTYLPDPSKLPIIKAGTIVSSNTGVKFELADDLNFAIKDSQGTLDIVKKGNYATMKKDSDGNPSTFSVKMTGLCSSGLVESTSFQMSDEFKPFRKITLPAKNVSEIIGVFDSDNNEYFEVEALTQDTVYTRVMNVGADKDLVASNIEMRPAPYRFISKTSRKTGKTTLTFGGGSALSTDDDIMPDPSEIAIPLFGKKKSFSRFAIDPNSLMKTRTLGIAPRNTTVSVRYRAGGGISHNVAAGSIRTITTLLTKFSSGVSATRISSTRGSVEINNVQRASGGEAAMTLNELRSTALSFKNSQSRIVTKEDLVARIYTMPSNFGRVFRVGIRDNPNNPLASTVAIISRDSSGRLIISPDTLKENLKMYVNEYRLISDAMDIVDARIINVGIKYGVVVDPMSNKNLVVQDINRKLSKYMKIENFQIDQPIMTADLISIIIGSQGVVSLVDFQVTNLTGTIDGRPYSDQTFSIPAHTNRGIIIPPDGSIYEVRFPNDDIEGVAR